MPVREGAVKAYRPVVQLPTAFAPPLPIGGGLWDRNVRVEGHRSMIGQPERVAFNAIAPGYFAAMRTPLRAGREFTDRDTASPSVAIVNESFARAFFGDRSAIGRRVMSVGANYEIVGVVGDAKYEGLREGSLRTMYVPWMQRNENTVYGYLVRAAAGDPRRLAPAVERVLGSTDRSLRLARLVTYREWIDLTIPTERLMATVAGLIGLLALVLAGVGMFGVLAFQVARRTNELGVRAVLGATRWSTIRLVLRDMAAIVMPGVAIGAAAAMMLTRLARGLLFGLTPTDPGAFALSASILAAAALLAGWVPARRASLVDPLVALRHE